MSHLNLRKRPRISYYEPDEPNLDEYVFCTSCGDFVYEYCAIHGPLLVIPDTKIPADPGVPPHVPRSALTIPSVFLHINRSRIPGAGLGVFASRTLPSGVRFGPYRGKKTTEINSDYCWQLRGANGRPSLVVDASDRNHSNWMRFVNCSRHWLEQNLVSYQYRGNIYYRTIRIIPKFTELLVFYGSEFALHLGIDLRRYNSPIGYAQKLGAPILEKNKSKEVTVAQTSNNNASSVKSGLNKGSTVQESNPAENNTDRNKPNTKNTKNLTARNNNINEKIKPKNYSKSQIKKKNKINNDTIMIKENSTKKKATKFQPPIKINKPSKENAHKIKFTCNICPFKTDSEDKLRNHSQIHNGDINNNFNNVIFNLDECKTQTKNLNRKTDTNINVSKSNVDCDVNLYIKNLSCDICTYTTNNENDLIKHLDIHIGKRVTFKDRKTIIIVSKLKQYIVKKNINNKNKTKNKHSANEIKPDHKTIKSILFCDNCTYATDNKNDLINHMLIHSANNIIDVNNSCTICNKIQPIKLNLNQNILINPNKKLFVCNFHGKQLTDNTSLSADKKYPIGDIPNGSPSNETFIDKRISRVNKHSVTDNNIKPFKCDICCKEFTQKSYLKVHYTLIHGDEKTKKYVCDICSKPFSCSSSLNNHRLIHSNIKSFKCAVCERAFTHKNHLKDHIRIHTGERPYSCNICSKQFTQSSHLNTHSLTHSNIKSFKCAVCERAFTHKSNLKGHIRIHTGERPYSCKICSKQFTQSSNLNTHSLTHSNIKSFKCAVCERAFTQKSKLKAHTRVHTT